MRDQVVTPFASTGARDSAISSPVAGMVEYLTTNTSAEGLTTYTSASTWRPPWNLPWGYAPISALPGSFTFTTVQANSAAFTWTAVDNRFYQVTVMGEFQSAADLTGTISTLWVELSPSGTDVFTPVLRYRPIDSVTQQLNVSGSFVFEATSSGTQTWRLSAQSSLDASTQTFVPYSIIIVDIGPAGAPA